MKRHFQTQLDKLTKRLIKMSSIVNEQVNDVLKAVEIKDQELAEKIIDREPIVNKHDLKIEKQCVKLVALNQPVAMDLRFVFSTITINTSLERIGDLTVNIAKQLKETNYTHEELELIHFSKISDLVKQMVSKSIDAFILKDTELAKEVLTLEKTLNQTRDNESENLKKYLKENLNRFNSSFFLYDMIHALERIGDLCTNIVEDIYFILEAQNIRHKYSDILFSEPKDSEDI